MSRDKEIIAVYERAFSQMKIDNDRRKYFNEMATMQQIQIAEKKVAEIRTPETITEWLRVWS